MATSRTAGLDIRTLEDREVLFHFGDNPWIDKKTGIFGPGWHSGGLEPADGEWGLTRTVNSNKVNLTGGQTPTSYTAADVTSTVNLIPGSPVLDTIEWPDTTEAGGVLYRKHTSRVAKAFAARVHRYTSGIIHIVVSREKANLTAAERNRGTDPAGRAVTIDYTNGPDEVMFEEMYFKAGEDGKLMEVKPKVFKDIETAEKMVEEGKAFVPSASGSGLKAFVPAVDDDEEDGVELIEFTDPKTGKKTSQPDSNTGVASAGTHSV